jgi:toxin-antitoxin system PIN domain toxin
MIVPDTNLLLYAYNASSPFHATARQWWEECLSGHEPVGLVHAVLFSFLRISTSRRAVPEPFTLTEAAGHITSWLERKVTRLLHEGPDHVNLVVQLLEQAGSVGGNLVTDAQVASLAITYHGTVHTADRDFQRFPGLSCRFPLHE